MARWRRQTFDGFKGKYCVFMAEWLRIKMGYWRMWHVRWETTPPSKARYWAFRRMVGTGTFSSEILVITLQLAKLKLLRRVVLHNQVQIVN